MNAFVDYLNSMHSINGDGLGALAERQIQSPFSVSCHVPRNLGSIIAKSVSEGDHRAYIITGHAGDGKTSILVQVLRELDMIQSGELLMSEKTCSSSKGSLYYVKDMSELRPAQRALYLRKALQAPSNGLSSILISNTGPLLTTFESVLKEDRESAGQEYDSALRLANQTELLNQLDTNQSGERVVGGYSFSMINIARIDNVSFATSFIDKILQNNLWLPCENCAKKEKCPIFSNYSLVNQNRDRIKEFVNYFLRYTYEYDQRLTIRQIQAQICYALTGALNCNSISLHKDYSFFKYGFPNLFFGYQGDEENPAALKIKAIHILHDMNLDSIALPIDYDLFVKGITDVFPEGVRKTIEGTIIPKLKRLDHSSDLDIKKRNKKMISLRRSIRRYYLLFGNYTQSDVIDKVFGEGFLIYEDVSSHVNTPLPKRNKMRDTIFSALYLNNTGFLPHSSSNAQVPLTLHRKDNVFQSVMLVLGHVPKNDLRVTQKHKLCEYEEDSNRQQVMLEFRDKQFSISLPLYLYFVSQSRGAVTPACNPALTHNITRLETMLTDAYKNSDVDEIELLTNTTSGQQYQTMIISEDRIHLY